MAKPQHRTAAHRRERQRLTPIVQRGDAYCAEPICLMPTRWIQPGTPWHVSHDPTGTYYLGPSHEKCNTSEGATRGNKQRKPGKLRRWVL